MSEKRVADLRHHRAMAAACLTRADEIAFKSGISAYDATVLLALATLAQAHIDATRNDIPAV